MSFTVLDQTFNDMTLSLRRINKKINLYIKYYDGAVLLDEAEIKFLHTHSWQIKAEIKNSHGWFNVEPFTKKGVRHYRIRQIVQNTQMSIEFPYFYAFEINQFIFLALTFYDADARTDRYVLRDEVMHAVSSLYMKQSVVECPKEPTIEDFCIVQFDDSELHSVMEKVLKAFMLPFPDLSLEDKIEDNRTALIDLASKLEVRVDDSLLHLIKKIFRVSMK